MTALSAGYDLYAHLPRTSITITSGETALIPLGFAMAFTAGYEAQIRPRSGLAAKHAVTVLNAPGTIDADYRGEVAVLLINHHPRNAFRVKHGERVAQMVFAQCFAADLEIVETLNDTDRGSGGFGSTG